MSDKPKFAMYWAASCGGCEISVLNIAEKILDFDANFEPVFWPVAMDAKYKDVEAMADGSILLTLWNGGIRTEENEHLAHLLAELAGARHIAHQVLDQRLGHAGVWFLRH